MSEPDVKFENFFGNDNNKEKKGKYPFYCNVWSCYHCHKNQKRLSPQEIQKIKERNKNNNIFPKPKRCDGYCNYCCYIINKIQNY